MQDTPEILGEYRGFRLIVKEGNKRQIYLKNSGLPYGIDIGDSQIGNIVRIENTLANLDKYVEECTSRMERCQLDLEESKQNSRKVFLHEEELQNKLKRQAELNELLEVDKKVENLMDEDSMGKAEEVVVKEKIEEIVTQFEERQELEDDEYEIER